MLRGSSSLAARAVAALLLALGCALPMGMVAWTLMSNPQVFRDLTPSAFRLELLGRTLGYNALAAGIAVVMGTPVGLVLGRSAGPAPRSARSTRWSASARHSVPNGRRCEPRPSSPTYSASTGSNS